MNNDYARKIYTQQKLNLMESLQMNKSIDRLHSIVFDGLFIHKLSKTSAENIYNSS